MNKINYFWKQESGLLLLNRSASFTSSSSFHVHVSTVGTDLGFQLNLISLSPSLSLGLCFWSLLAWGLFNMTPTSTDNTHTHMHKFPFSVAPFLWYKFTPLPAMWNSSDYSIFSPRVGVGFLTLAKKCVLVFYGGFNLHFPND